MSYAITGATFDVSAPLLPATELLPRKRFTRAEVERLERLGAFEGQRYELIDGDLLDKMRQNPRHALAIRRTSSRLGLIS